MSATVLGYYGSKNRMADTIAAALPAHAVYVEPFCGSLAVLLAKPRAPRFEVVNDLDQDLMTFWRVLRDHTEDLARVCALTPHSRAEYAQAWPAPADATDLERARRVWVKLAQGRGGTMRTTGWRHYLAAHGRTSSMPQTLAGYVDRFAQVADRLAGVTLEALDALDIIARYGDDPEALLYLDPPYLGTTRARTMYRHELHTEAEHRALAAAVADVPAIVVLSGYPSPLYDELYAGWHRLEFGAFTGQANTKDAGQRTEVLWCNRPIGEGLW